ncbi:MAG: hypothetical protein HKP13_01120, partial [Gammaproteobacteria bacterium]|nr:hypothetical protein [Gammaproteobacteria bacterium]
MKMKQTTPFLGLLLFFPFAWATWATTPDYCDIVLDQKLKESYGVESLGKYQDYLRESLNYSHDRIAAYVNANDGSLPIPPIIATAIARAEIADSDKRQRFDASRTKYGPDPTLVLDRRDFDTLTADLVDDGVLMQWNQCRKDTGVSSNGIVYRINDRDKAIFSITVTYIP